MATTERHCLTIYPVSPGSNGQGAKISHDVEKHPAHGHVGHLLVVQGVPCTPAREPASVPMAPTVPWERADGANGSLRAAMSRC
jgi:hypothetical protein